MQTEKFCKAAGTTVFTGLLPGTYTFTEIVSSNGAWQTLGVLTCAVQH